MNTFLRSHRKVIWFGNSPLRRTKNPAFATCHRACFGQRYRSYNHLTYLSRTELERTLVGNHRHDFGYQQNANSNVICLAPSMWHAVREFSISQRLYENPSSKVEVTVQNMKSKQKEKVDEIMKEASTASRGDISRTTAASEAQVRNVVVKKPLKTRIWEEIVHYYHGFRLLFIDINISRKLLWRVLNGKKLSRRENRLLVQTTSDLFRLIPFSVFIIVPFMELALPLFIKLFPNLLPSTFQTAKEREDKLKQSLQVRLEMARFLQKTLDEMAVQNNTEQQSDEAKQFANFFERIKNPNEYVPTGEIIKFAKHFDSEVTLDSLSREQLAALCRVLELHTIGTSTFLRFQLRLKLRSLAADDRVIAREGVNALDLFELQQACKARGMRAYGLTEERLRTQLQEWIDLSLNEKVPPTLLLLSRALLISDDVNTTEKLKETIRVLPDAVAAHTRAAIGESEGKIDNKAKIEILKNEEKKIREEREEERQEEAKKEEAKKEEDKAQVLVAKDAPPLQPQVATRSAEPATKTASVEVSDADKGKISTKDVDLISEALKKVSSEKHMQVEKERIKTIKEELQDYKEDIEELREVRDVVKEPVHETRAAKVLFKKVNRMISRLDDVLKDLEQKQKKIATELEPEATPEKRKQDELVRVDELVQTIKKLQQTSDESRLKHISDVLSKLDSDKDGAVTVEELLAVVKAMGRDSVSLDDKQMAELLELIKKEKILDAEEKIEKALERSKKEAKKAEEIKTKLEAELRNGPVLKDKAPELKDPAPELKDTATDLSSPPSKCIAKKNKPGIKSEENMLPPIPPPANQVNPKDKRL